MRWPGRTRRPLLGTEADRARFRTLHLISRASPALRAGLTEASAQKSVAPLRELLGTPAVALADTSGLLAWEGSGQHHSDRVPDLVAATLTQGGLRAADARLLSCANPHCEVRHAITTPLTVDDRMVGVLLAFAPSPSAALLHATHEVGQWVSSQLDLAELDAERTRTMQAEVRALRAQISPHFVYNSLSAIASFVRTDPDRARDLLLEFADFTRYSFRSHGEFTTLAEELRSIEQYLVLEQARFGDRLQVTLQVAPEVLGVALPFLCIQPLAENAVRHGLEKKDGPGHLHIRALDHDHECLIEVEDDGVGEDPDRVRRALAGDAALDSVGLGNVDARLRNAFGEEYGLVVETAPGAGTKVTLRVPKFARGVHP